MGLDILASYVWPCHEIVNVLMIEGTMYCQCNSTPYIKTNIPGQEYSFSYYKEGNVTKLAHTV